MEKVYFSVMSFILVALCFPVMQNAVIDANLTNSGLDLMLMNFPVILLLILAVFPILLYFKEKNK